MAKTYTKLRLTGPMLKRLSQIVNRRKHNAGVALQALERRGLVRRCDNCDHAADFGPWCPACWNQRMVATQAGINALALAREQGW